MLESASRASNLRTIHEQRSALFMTAYTHELVRCFDSQAPESAMLAAYNLGELLAPHMFNECFDNSVVVSSF